MAEKFRAFHYFPRVPRFSFLNFEFSSPNLRPSLSRPHSEWHVEFPEREDGRNDGVDHADRRALSLARLRAPGSGNGYSTESGRAETRERKGDSHIEVKRAPTPAGELAMIAIQVKRISIIAPPTHRSLASHIGQDH